MASKEPQPRPIIKNITFNRTIESIFVEIQAEKPIVKVPNDINLCESRIFSN
jgi:hypothetical protein